MLIAREKFATNIIEYLLYMWQLEDLLRAKSLDPVRIEKEIVSGYHRPPEEMQKISEWYRSLAERMAQEELQNQGHLASLNRLVEELNDLHLNLLNDLHDQKYAELYGWAKEPIRALKQKIGKPGMLEIEACLQGLYGLLLMRLQKREVSAETLESLSTFSHLLAHLNQRYFVLCRKS